MLCFLHLFFVGRIITVQSYLIATYEVFLNLVI